LPAAGPRAVTSCQSATKGRSGTRIEPIDAEKRSYSFPKKYRILRTGDYRRVYDEGFRVSGPYFLAFCLAAESAGPRIGLTAPRAVGKAVDRNRVKRRLRESVRRQLWRLGPQWNIVFNARRSMLSASFDDLMREVERVFRKCKGG